jgi:hypothetical protein
MAAFVVAGVAGLAWLVHLRLRPDFQGFAPGLTLFGVPALVFGLTFIWLLARGVAEGTARWNFVIVLIGACAFAYATTALMCGPVACFVPGQNRYMGWFIVAGVAAAALAHHFVRERLRVT